MRSRNDLIRSDHRSSAITWYTSPRYHGFAGETVSHTESQQRQAHHKLAQEELRLTCLSSRHENETGKKSESIPPLPALQTVWGSKTSTAIKRNAGIGEDNIPRERLLVVDLSAPVTVLKSQFSACLERFPKQKISAGPGYADWEDLGVLPFIDMEFWRLITLREDIRQRVVPRIIYSDRHVYTAKNVDETTIPHVHKMLNTSSRLRRVKLHQIPLRSFHLPRKPGIVGLVELEIRSTSLHALCGDDANNSRTILCRHIHAEDDPLKVLEAIFECAFRGIRQVHEVALQRDAVFLLMLPVGQLVRDAGVERRQYCLRHSSVCSTRSLPVALMVPSSPRNQNAACAGTRVPRERKKSTSGYRLA